ncbi:hypothetical protein [Halorussus ruber]|uniref:hypothetical protein n=1 Tax=Halorussus ruber TaxID=1126238 RepID=UPI001091B036|nr:hypothetical protein [Halorussus ruber]
MELRELLEEKTGTLLLIAGGYLSIQSLIRTFPDFVGFTTPARLPGWAGFIFFAALPDLVGFAIPFVALFGLYHRLTSEAPRLAAVGVTLMALTPILFVSGLLTLLVRPVPRVPYLLWLSPLPYTMGTGAFGLAFFRKPAPIRFVGVPLLVFSGTWILLYVVSLKNGRVPDWFPTVELQR